MVKPKNARVQAPARDPTAAPSPRCEAPGHAMSWVLRFLIREAERDPREDDLWVKDLEQGLERIRQGSGDRGCCAGEGLLLPAPKAGSGLGELVRGRQRGPRAAVTPARAGRPEYRWGPLRDQAECARKMEY